MALTLDSYIQDLEGKEQRTDRQTLTFKPEEPLDVPPSYLISAGYDGDRHTCFIRLYEPKTHRVYFWYDKTGHKPYCFSDLPPEELQRNEAVARNPGFDRLVVVEKYDALRDRAVKMTKILAKDPLTIGGKPSGSIRDAIKAWEADIKYVENYIYDLNLEPGMLYEVRGGELIQVKYEPPEDAVREMDDILKEESKEYRALAYEWMRLLECPVPSYRRAALDIEVYQPVATRVPDPREAGQQVICASVVTSDGVKRVLLLRRREIREGEAPVPLDARLEYYEKETDLLVELFKLLYAYPVIVTFNGDDFDLNYLYHRARNLGMSEDEIPIEMGRDVAYLKYGVHIDLYKFFFNRSIQIYAFGQKYRENTLDEVGEALIGMGKLGLEGPVSELSYRELAAYCLRDAEIVMGLTSFDDDLVMKLMTALSRISYMTIDDVSRQGVSGWIRSFMFAHHRKRGYLIPRQDEILGIKGKETLSTQAVIRGKKYKGAIVVEPKPGVHFNVAVLDFASLYPSIIKVHNLGYETVRCPHEDRECRGNIVPGTHHWVCGKKQALESLLIGSLRDLRVKLYKPRSKRKDIPRHLQSWYRVVSDALKVVLNASVPYDEPVVLQDPEGKVQLMSIGEFVEASVAENGAYFDGINFIAEPLEGWRVLSFNPRTGRVDFANIDAVIKHENAGEKMLEVTLESGRRVRVTPSHSLLTLDGRSGRVAPLDAEDIRPGDLVCVPVGMPPIEQENCEVNVVQGLARLPLSMIADIALFIYDKIPTDVRRTQVRVLKALAYAEGLTAHDVAARSGLDVRTVKRNLRALMDRGYVCKLLTDPRKYRVTIRGAYHLPLEEALALRLKRKKGGNGYYYVKLADILDVVGKIDSWQARTWRVGLYGRGKTKHKISATLTLTPELARFLGYYVAEGHAYFFDNKAGYRSYRVTITNNDEEILREICECTKAVFGIEPWILGKKNIVLDSKLIYLLLIRLLETGENAGEKRAPSIILSAPASIKMAFLEACFRGDGSIRGSEIEFTSKSATLMNQLSLILMQLGVKGLTLTSDSGVQRLIVRDRLPFVGKAVKRKNYSYVFPVNYVKDLASRLSVYRHVYDQGKNLDRGKALNLVNAYIDKSGNNPAIRNLQLFLSSDLALDRIKEIREISSIHEYVYDLSVDGAENFIGGYGMVCLHNSYGVFGAEIFALYCPPVAEATAAIGRHVIESSIKKAEELGIDVFYGDTDSIFLGSQKPGLLRDLIDWSNSSLRMELEIDKNYRYVALSSRKKNYLGVHPDGSIDIKGLTGKKRHIPGFLKSAFYEMIGTLSQVKSPEEFEAARNRITSTVKTCYVKLRNREYPLDELAFSVMIGRPLDRYVRTTPQHVKAAKLLAAKGVEIKPGDIISFVKVIGEPGVKPVQLATPDEIDVQKYMEYIRSTFEQVLDALDVEFDELVGVTRLESFSLEGDRT